MKIFDGNDFAIINKCVNLQQNLILVVILYKIYRGWSGGAMVLGKLPVPGRPTIWIQ